jgi:hypothetical protein
MTKTMKSCFPKLKSVQKQKSYDQKTAKKGQKKVKKSGSGEITICQKSKMSFLQR